MGFFIMLFSMIAGIFLVVFAISRLKNNKGIIWNIVAIILGITLALFAIWLGLPK